MRAAIAQALMNDAQLLSLGLPASNVYPVNAVDTFSKPFVTLRFSERAAGIGGIGAISRLPVQKQLLECWWYDEPGDYIRIDNFILRAKQLFDSIVGAQTATGWISQIDWLDDGQDDWDDVYKAITRRSSFYVVASATKPG